MRTSSDQRYQGAEVVRANVVTPAEPAMQTAVTRAAAAFGFKGHTQNDLDCLTQGVYYEARGEGVDGMRAVAQVILNRVRHPAYPKSVCNVVYQGAHLRTSCQFSFTCNGALGRPVEKWAWRRARDVAQAALNGHVMPAVGTATSFHTTGVNPRWSGTMERVTQVGTHIFYQFRGRGSRMGGDGVVVPSNAVPQIVQADTTETPVASDALNQAQAGATQPADALAPNVSMAPTTKSPTGDARAALIAAVAKASPEPPRAISVKSTVSGKSAQDITAEVAMKSGGVSQ
ncbi:cell Wall Hydrolase family protein [Asticcacaulis biprosthecium C19]|uniref:Cell Wall Hydrolase family protein n=1 Tax=Asticcacaulis biprosthecium C19 TaxID=715226 RepID=F4QPJ1_9CAUL|nr:cell wall hydrolase [Asticcacaulis biprosthecium]EGF91249.1 cell Wall Hydrolase family protein [Asticcacaulis biprosthecium C19]